MMDDSEYYKLTQFFGGLMACADEAESSMQSSASGWMPDPYVCTSPSLPDLSIDERYYHSFENGIWTKCSQAAAIKSRIWRRFTRFRGEVHIGGPPERGRNPTAQISGTVIEYLKGVLLNRWAKPARIVRVGDFVAVEYHRSGYLHREYGPAVLRYQNKKLVESMWWRAGHLDNVYAPADVYTGEFSGLTCKIFEKKRRGVWDKPFVRWSVHGIVLEDFEKYYDASDPGNSLMKFVKEHPRYAYIAIQMALRNAWLSLAQLAALDAIILFDKDRYYPGKD